MTEDRQLRRRGEALRRAVLDAALDEIATNGVAAATVQTVAHRAGVHETSVYRRWKTRENLLLDALTSRLDLDVAAPDTGSIRGDFIAIIMRIAAFHQTPVGLGLLQAATQAPPEQNAALQSFWEARRQHFVPVLERAIARGELPVDVDADLLMEVLVSTLHFRTLLSRREITPEFSERLTDFVLRATTSATMKSRLKSV